MQFWIKSWVQGDAEVKNVSNNILNRLRNDYWLIIVVIERQSYRRYEKSIDNQEYVPPNPKSRMFSHRSYYGDNEEEKSERVASKIRESEDHDIKYILAICKDVDNDSVIHCFLSLDFINESSYFSNMSKWVGFYSALNNFIFNLDNPLSDSNDIKIDKFEITFSRDITKDRVPSRYLNRYTIDNIMKYQNSQRNEFFITDVLKVYLPQDKTGINNHWILWNIKSLGIAFYQSQWRRINIYNFDKNDLGDIYTESSLFQNSKKLFVHDKDDKQKVKLSDITIPTQISLKNTNFNEYGSCCEAYFNNISFEKSVDEKTNYVMKKKMSELKAWHSFRS